MDDLEEDKTAQDDQFAGLNKKQQKIMKNLKNRAVKKMLFVQPEKEWAIYSAKNVYMESFRDENDNKVFNFVERDLYKEIQNEFRSVQQSYDIHMMLQFMQRNFFHHETLVHVSDFLRIQGKFPDAVKLIQRCMFAFEILFPKDFVICGPKPHTRINFNNEESNLANVFADCLVRHIDNLGRKGCIRTALEFTKFFLSLDPENDPFGNLLKIDYYSLRSGEYKYLASFAEKFSKEFYHHPLKTVLLTPNLLLSTAIARFKLSGKIEDRTALLDKAHSDINIFVALIQEKACEESPKILQSLYNFSAEGLMMLGIAFYPTLVKQLLIKVEADKKPNPQKSFYVNHQKSAWSKIIEHSMFEFNEDDELFEHSLGLDSDVLSKYFDLYVDRTSDVYKDDDILEWLRQVLGYVLNETDNESFDREVLFQFVFSSVGLPFELRRYANLSKEFFNDDFTTVNPQELLGGGAGQGAPAMANVNQAELRARLQQMMNNRQIPPQMQQQFANAVRNHGQPPVDHDNLILEDPEMIREQELIMQNLVNQQPLVEEEEIIIRDAGDDEVRRGEDDE